MSRIPTHELDVDLLMQLLDEERTERGMSWRQVAKEIGVSPSTFTRMACDRKPSVDAFLSMCDWCGAYAEEMTTENTELTLTSEEPMSRLRDIREYAEAELANPDYTGPVHKESARRHARHTLELLERVRQMEEALRSTNGYLTGLRASLAWVRELDTNIAAVNLGALEECLGEVRQALDTRNLKPRRERLERE